MSGLALTLTDVGRAALINAHNNGTNDVLLAEIGVSSTHFVADTETAMLPDEIKRLTTFAGQTVAADTLHVTLRDDSADSYTLRSFALYLDNGTLLAVYSQPEAILEKSAQAIVLLSLDIRLLQEQAALIQFGPADFINPPASHDRPGVIALATDDQALSGTDTERAITAITLKTVLDQHQQPWDRVTDIPASVHIPGQVILFAGAEPPAGTLACDGSLVSRSQYPALFAAIGTKHGEGDGHSTFQLPNIPEEFALVNTHNANKVGTPTSGENKHHTHTTTVSTNGKHTHSASSQAAGHHLHTASSTAAGSHAHSASSGVAGNHVHSAWTDAQGEHTHSCVDYPGWNAKKGSSRSVAHWNTRFGSQTGAAGHHAHNVGIGANGNHAHSISIAANGQHIHAITVAENGSHTHPISVAENGEHDHSVTNTATGGKHNLPAGFFIRCCIAY